MINIKANLDKIKAQIVQACQQSGRLISSTQKNGMQLPVLLLAVSKTKPVKSIEEAYLAGQRDFGENYLQEAVEKVELLKHLPEITWHFIGPIQSNKTKMIANNFSWVHSIDREKVALRLNQHLIDNNNNTQLNVCLQVNISNEDSKSGINIEDVYTLAEIVHNCDKLSLRGLMAVPQKGAPSSCYQQLQSVFEELQQKYKSVDTLSLGMSSDLDVAVKHGSTMVRIGTAIFGERTYTN